MEMRPQPSASPIVRRRQFRRAAIRQTLPLRGGARRRPPSLLEVCREIRAKIRRHGSGRRHRTRSACRFFPLETLEIFKEIVVEWTGRRSIRAPCERCRRPDAARRAAASPAAAEPALLESSLAPRPPRPPCSSVPARPPRPPSEPGERAEFLRPIVLTNSGSSVVGADDLAGARRAGSGSVSGANHR
jgi:hypothetical protein